MADDPCDDWLTNERAYSLLLDERIRAKKAGDHVRNMQIKRMIHETYGHIIEPKPVWQICYLLGLFL